MWNRGESAFFWYTHLCFALICSQNKALQNCPLGGCNYGLVSYFIDCVLTFSEQRVLPVSLLNYTFQCRQMVVPISEGYFVVRVGFFFFFLHLLFVGALSISYFNRCQITKYRKNIGFDFINSFFNL